MKILMLHGSRQSGELFKAKIQAIEKLTKQALKTEIEFIYPTAPFALEPQGEVSELRDRHGAWTWFQSVSLDSLNPGLEKSLDFIASILKISGPFDGIIGFSQGAALGVMVAAILENYRDREMAFRSFEAGGGMLYPASLGECGHPPLKFVVSISGYVASHAAYRGFYEPAICTPSLHYWGSLDTVVDEEASMRLVNCCQGSEGAELAPCIIRHPGGHVVPSGKRQLVGIVHFMKSCMEE
ncbi:hypothetical protein N7520_008824 [Penicillium odoratum]|uniref:uncharacterized protein n=1 Tax=Penicillium odoratum TaxID=1167516 RepID=UPI002547158E|nr:uncharacterized protein N7520_008824 [Penicillium odoratum]KAJ5751907.1 hypothetical protein N7520_008824 [Penicillium odoratum]